MSEVDFKNMKNVDLVRYAREQGHNVRGLSRDRIIDLLTVTPVQSIALPDEEATLCAMRTCPNRITVKTVGSIQTVLAPKEPEELISGAEIMDEMKKKVDEAVTKGVERGRMSWAQVRAKAKELGIKTYGKKRVQVETEIKEKQNG